MASRWEGETCHGFEPRRRGRGPTWQFRGESGVIVQNSTSTAPVNRRPKQHPRSKVLSISGDPSVAEKQILLLAAGEIRPLRTGLPYAVPGQTGEVVEPYCGKILIVTSGYNGRRSLGAIRAQR